jgi:hypothetical protein
MKTKGAELTAKFLRANVSRIPFHQRRTGCIPFHRQQYVVCVCEGGTLSTTSSMYVQGVHLSTTISVYVQGVSQSTACIVGVQGV